MFEITDRPIDVEHVARSVSHPENGAMVVFVGTVRDHSEGRKVIGLEYEAYTEMALEQMRLVADEIAQRWGVTRVAMVHRTGRLEVGEAAVVIAVGSGHRQEGFDACRHAINRIKEIVPIWKKELYPDGAEWKNS